MTLVMDGVRPTSAKSTRVVLPQRRPEVHPLPAGQRQSFVGMDGVRRTVAAPIDSAATVAPAKPAFVMPRLAISLPKIHVPHFEWRRQAVAGGLIATALVASGLAVHAVATPPTTTAHAESSIVKPLATPAPVVAKVAPVVPQEAAIQQILNNFVVGNTDKFGIVVKDMKTGATASYNADHQIESASLYKLFVAKGIYQRIDLGQLSYSQPAGGGSGRTIGGCLTVMINISDNTCGRALGAILGWGQQNQALGLEGYKETDLATPQQTSAGDVATLLDRLYSGTLVSADSSAQFLGLLKDQRVNNRLPVGLPAGTIIAHKTGDLDGVVHDAGIVYGPKTNYMVVVTSGPWNSPGNAPAMFANLSSQLWHYFEQ